MAAFSSYDVRLILHQARPLVQDVVEFDSLLAYYRLGQPAAQSAPVLRDKQRLETQPSWDPNGRYLYFASAPKLWSDMTQFPPPQFAELRYDIQRVAYDVTTDTWGTLETIVSAQRLGKSCLAPRVSPDGRFLLFTACAYGCFPLYLPDSDLYLMDLRRGTIQRLDCNSDAAENWHAWSSNGRWIAFSSKRPSHHFTRIYFSYIDSEGRARKPFCLPQEDPAYYDACLDSFNVPELMTGPVPVSARRLLRAVRSQAPVPIEGVTQATPRPPAAYRGGAPVATPRTD